MPAPKVSDAVLRTTYNAVKKYGSAAAAAIQLGEPASTIRGRMQEAIVRLGMPDPRIKATPAKAPEQPKPKRGDVNARVKDALKSGRMPLDALASHVGETVGTVLDAIDAMKGEGQKIKRETGGVFSIEVEPPEPAWTKGASVEIISRPDNSFVFGAMGDLHAGSKYCRWDAREDLIRRAEKRGAQAIFDTGNYLDGHAPFNRYDLEAVGMAQQTRLLATKHPKTTLPVYAVTGDDHEGWYSQREGVDIGWYTEKTMRENGHNWTDLGYMEAHVKLVNANTGKFSILAVVHPGGGSAYALSYRPQKIIESLEGGEKPAVLLLGHYHKLEAGNTRNVWYVQTGCCQDQTPFMRKKSLEAHVGGAIITLEQDPRTGAILGMTPELIRFFNRNYHDLSRRWSHHGGVELPPRER